MGLGDFADKAKEALGSEKAEEPSDRIISRAADAAKKATGGKLDDRIDDAARKADEAIGNE